MLPGVAFFNLINGIFRVFYKKFDLIILKIWSLLLFSQSVRELMGDWKERSVNRPRREWIPSDNTLDLPLFNLNFIPFTDRNCPTLEIAKSKTQVSTFESIHHYSSKLTHRQNRALVMLLSEITTEMWEKRGVVYFAFWNRLKLHKYYQLP